RPLEHPRGSPAIWRPEFVNGLYEFLVSPLLLEPLQGTPFLAWYLRLLGARVGRRTYLHTTGFLEWDLVEVGDETMVNEDCVLQTHLFEDRVLKASRLRIGRGCEVGALSVVLYDTEMGDGTRLEALSLLMKGESLPAGTSWIGVPAAWRAPARAGRKARSAPARSSPWGRPELIAPTSHPRLRFSLSHADGIALCAVTRGGAVGADVESLRHVGPDPLGVAATLCSERERETLLATPAPLRAERFLSLWTLKEAFAKATGLGFRLDLERITVRLGPARAAELEFDHGGGAEASLWRFASKS